MDAWYCGPALDHYRCSHFLHCKYLARLNCFSHIVNAWCSHQPNTACTKSLRNSSDAWKQSQQQQLESNYLQPLWQPSENLQEPRLQTNPLIIRPCYHGQPQRVRPPQYQRHPIQRHRILLCAQHHTSTNTTHDEMTHHSQVPSSATLHSQHHHHWPPLSHQ